ncbi:MAG: hypothetical protein SO101_15675 [Lachnospiraceae bacterium]|nr:hypothetical protein [Lachnospiraceae bacterium]
MQILIEFLLEEGADSNAFKTAYENAGLPMNGPTITAPLIKMMNTLSDGIMILIILLISLCMFADFSGVHLFHAVDQSGFGGRRNRNAESCGHIRKSFWMCCLPYVIAGIAFGTFCGCILGERICGMALQSLGAVGFRFILHIRPIMTNVILGGAAAILAVYLGSSGIRNIKAVECCRGRG